MDHARFSAIAHGAMAIMNPLPEPIDTALAWAPAHPEDPDAFATRDPARHVWHRYRSGGRAYLGFAAYLFEVA